MSDEVEPEEVILVKGDVDIIGSPEAEGLGVSLLLSGMTRHDGVKRFEARMTASDAAVFESKLVEMAQELTGTPH